MVYAYDLILYRPLLNALIFFYNTIAFQDLGLSIIFLTVLIRLVLFPVFHKSARHQAVMQRLQPELKKIQEVHKHDKEKQTKAMMALYKEHGANPFSGFLLMLVQIPVLLALFQISRNSLSPQFLSGLYNFVAAPTAIRASLFGLINLRERSILIVALAALAQYFQAKLSLPRTSKGQKLSPQEMMGRQMVFIGPILTVAIFYNFPAAIGLYWLTTSLLSILQQVMINGKLQSRDQHGQLGNIAQKDSRISGV